jgi:hypothetical protein
MLRSLAPRLAAWSHAAAAAAAGGAPSCSSAAAAPAAAAAAALQRRAFAAPPNQMTLIRELREKSGAPISDVKARHRARSPPKKRSPPHPHRRRPLTAAARNHARAPRSARRAR